MSAKTIQQVLQEHRTWLLGLPQVTGLAQGGPPESPHITLYVRSWKQEHLQHYPRTLEGYPITLMETGSIQAVDQA